MKVQLVSGEIVELRGGDRMIGLDHHRRETEARALELYNHNVNDPLLDTFIQRVIDAYDDQISKMKERGIERIFRNE